MPNDTRSGLKISGNRSYGGSVLPRARTSILLKQCGIVLTENGTKGRKHPKKSFGDVLQEAWRTIPEDYLNK